MGNAEIQQVSSNISTYDLSSPSAILNDYDLYLNSSTIIKATLMPSIPQAASPRANAKFYIQEFKAKADPRESPARPSTGEMSVSDWLKDVIIIRFVLNRTSR